MTRKKARECAVLLCYEMGFHPVYDMKLLEARIDGMCSAPWNIELELADTPPEGEQRDYLLRLLNGIIGHKPELDAYIEKYSIGWHFHRIPRVAAAIMQVAAYEILYMPDIPDGAAIDEAVELTKRYDSVEISSFVNGVLGSFVREERIGHD